MAQDFSKLYLIVDWRDDVLMDFVDDLTLEHIEGQLLWEEAWHSCALDGVVVPFEEMDAVKEIAAKRLEYSEEIIEKVLKGKISEKKLSNVLSYSFDDIKPSWVEVIRYYEVALAMYGMALEMRENVLFLLPKLPRLIHRSLFYGIPGKEKSGEYRKTSSIEDAGVPSLLKELAPKDNIEEFMKIWSEFTRLLFVQRWNYTLDNVEYSHALFMSILPFEYGNGRVGRIIMNMLLLMAKYGNAIISSEEEEKKMYFRGLERGAKVFHEQFVSGQTLPMQLAILYQMRRSSDLIKSIVYGLADSYDILLNYYLKDKLVPLSEFVKQSGKKLSEVQRLVRSRKLIRKKIDGEWYVYPEIAPKSLEEFLGSGRMKTVEKESKQNDGAKKKNKK
ncbi:MAG: Fic family protein [Fervidobacterium sp.]|nr:Fic family protein [Fervidobacterium sp.]